MANKALRFYQESRLPIDPLSQDHVLDFDVPSHSSHYAFATRASPKRRRIDRAAPLTNEDDFSRSYLASQSGIYFRKPSASVSSEPRAILWRLLEKRSVLELQAVDLYQNADIKEEHNLSLRFRFPSPVRPNGVTFAQDPNGKLVVFVIPKGGELFEFILPKHAFSRPDALESTLEGDQWFHSDVPNALTYLVPHTLIAKDASQLWASLNDGGIVKLERRIGDDGEVSWNESFFTEGGWKASVRGWVTWKGSHSASFDGADFNAKTAVTIAPAPDGRHVWTVCLDHTLRAWDVSTGKIVWQTDLAGKNDRDLMKPPERLLDPAQSNLLNVVPSDTDDEYLVVTYSPQTRSFKTWIVRDASSLEHGIEDAQPDFDFTPPVEDLVETGVWNLENFVIRHLYDGRRKDLNLWLLVRSGTRYHALNVTFNPRDHTKLLKKAWADNWCESALDSNATDTLENMSGGPEHFGNPDMPPEGTDLVSQWMKYLFTPGRFSSASLEAGLAIYQRGLNPEVDTRKVMAYMLERAPLMERICEAVGSASKMGSNNFVDYNRRVAREWRKFYSLIKDLHKRREYALFLSIDPNTDLPWLLLADHVVPLRRCADIEVLWSNRQLYASNASIRPASHTLHLLGEKHTAEMSALLYVCDSLRDLVTASGFQSLRQSLQDDLQEYSADEVYDANTESRMGDLYDRTSIALGDEEYTSAIESMSYIGGFAELRSEIFHRILSLLDEEIHGSHQDKHLTKYGHRALIRGAQETLKLGLEVLESLFLLVVFVSSEVASEDMPAQLDLEEVFRALIERYRAYRLLDWCASSRCAELEGRPLSNPLDGFKASLSHQPTLTVMQWLWGNEFRSMNTIHGPDPQVLTYWSRAWTLNISKVVGYNELVNWTLVKLLKAGDLYLARDFVSKFEARDAWGSYLNARILIAWGEHETASLVLQSLSESLGKRPRLKEGSVRSGLTSNVGGAFALSNNDKAGLIDPTEQGNFGHGQARFLYHAMSLFHSAKAMSHVAEFAKLALQALRAEESSDQVLRTDLLSRLFSAALSSGRFREAFDTLVQQEDWALRQGHLKQFLDVLMSKHQIELLMSLKYDQDLAERVDELLAEKVVQSPVEERSPFDSDTDTVKPLPHRVLYSWRVSRNDLRGAAHCLWEYLQKLKQTREKNARGVDVDDQIAETYLGLINCLSLVKEEMRWLLVRPLAAAAKGKGGPRLGMAGTNAVQSQMKRKVITLDDIRVEWQRELDRLADIEAGRFAYPIGDEMQIEGSFESHQIGEGDLMMEMVS